MASASASASLSVDAIVRDLYGTLLEDVGFERCLPVLGTAFDAQFCALQTEHPGVRRAEMKIFGQLSASELLELSNAYATRWPGQNLWVERGFPHMMAKGYTDGDTVVTEQELLRSEYYQHFLKPVDVRHGLGISLHDPTGSMIAIASLNRSARTGPFNAADYRRIEMLRPHLMTAYAISRRITGLQDDATTLRTSFDRIPLGMLVLDHEGQVLEANEEASRLLLGGSGISRAAARTLRFAKPACQAKYVATLTRLADVSRARAPETIRVGGADKGASTLVLHLCGFPPSAGPVLVGRGRIIAFICELDRHSETQFAVQVLRATLDLTPTEASVVLALRSHHNPGDVAQALGLQITTVRSHLKHVFRKTRTSKQSELLRLLDRLLHAVPR